MTRPSGSDRDDFEPAGEGHLDETIAVSDEQQALIDTIADDERPAAVSFDLVNDQENGVYTAVADHRDIGGIVYRLAAADRIVLQAASVHTEFRHQGVATELIRRVLDDVRAQGMTTTSLCPIVRTFIEKHPEYADLVDAGQPGRMNIHRT